MIILQKFPKFDIYNPLSYDLEKFLKELDEDLRPYFRAAIGNYMITLNAQNEFKSLKRRSTTKWTGCWCTDTPQPPCACVGPCTGAIHRFAWSGRV